MLDLFKAIDALDFSENGGFSETFRQACNRHDFRR